MRIALLCRRVQTWTCHLLWPIEGGSRPRPSSSFEPSGPTAAVCFRLKRGRAGQGLLPKHTFRSFLRRERHWPATAARPSPPSGRTLKAASNETCSGPAHSKHQGRPLISSPNGNWPASEGSSARRGPRAPQGLAWGRGAREVPLHSLGLPCVPECLYFSGKQFSHLCSGAPVVLEPDGSFRPAGRRRLRARRRDLHPATGWPFSDIVFLPERGPQCPRETSSGGGGGTRQPGNRHRHA